MIRHLPESSTCAGQPGTPYEQSRDGDQNPAWQGLTGTARSEGLVRLSGVCDLQQLIPWLTSVGVQAVLAEAHCTGFFRTSASRGSGGRPSETLPCVHLGARRASLGPDLSLQACGLGLRERLPLWVSGSFRVPQGEGGSFLPPRLQGGRDSGPWGLGLTCAHPEPRV